MISFALDVPHKTGGGKNSTQPLEILQKVLNKTLLAQPSHRTVTDRMGTGKAFEAEVINAG